MASLLHRIARRCETHDRPSALRIRQLEQQLGMEPSPSTSDSDSTVENHANLRLIDCGNAWCRTNRASR
jgi:hypothetical protein